MKLPSDILVGQYLQFFTLIMAASITFVYTCGYTFGLFVHSLNDKCTQLFTKMKSLTTTVMKLLPTMRQSINSNMG